MILKQKNLTNIAIAALIIALAAWASLHVLVRPDAERVVGVVEVTELP